MRGNPVAYRNLYRHLRELISFLEISLDSDFILEELDQALYECRTTFGSKHPLTNQLLKTKKRLYQKYVDKKALPLSKSDRKHLENQIQLWVSRYYKHKQNSKN
ncbi:MAG: hypothetical protein EU542_06475 [Promethearchaeota archaeon]|nr:MAG: hypothetical protein EU542_06475 [Candidatus Lokiarchaeota archaeon]